MRTRNSKKNAFTSIIANCTKIFIGFIAQKIFISTLGAEYLGLNGLFNNIISMLAIAELGVGSAIIYSLYEPIAKEDKQKIKQLVNFYKKAYSIIACVILVLGIAVAPFVPYFAKNANIDNIILFYLLFLLDILLTYVVAYKSSIINAYQKNYIINIIQAIYLLIMNSLQIVFLLLTKQYLAYLLIKIVVRIFENLLISIQFNKHFKWLEATQNVEMDKNTKNDIISKVKALMIHKLSEFFVTGTDNLIISKFLGLISVGLYSNYYMIINAIQSLFTQMFRSIVSSIGNLLTEKSSQKSYYIYDKMLFLNYWVISFCAICIFFLIKPFIIIWIGEKYLLSSEIVFVLVIVFYSIGMRNTPSSFKSAGGIFVEDKYIPIVESLVNLVFSIVLVIQFGLIGVFIGTFLSTLVLHLYSYPKFVYKKLFNKESVGYIIEQLKYALLFIVNFCVVYLILYFIKLNNSLIQLFVNLGICILIPNIINYLLYRKSEKFLYFKNYFLKKNK